MIGLGRSDSSPAIGCGALSAVIADLPDFPWPPPQPSDRLDLQRSLVVGPDEADISLTELARRLQSALEAVGYAETRFFDGPPGGFAMATRLEAFREDGRPQADRFRFSDPDNTGGFSLQKSLRRLFSASEGNYRILVFVVTDKPYSVAEESISERDLGATFARGSTELTEAFDACAFGSDHRIDTLVYEFYKGGADSAPEALSPGKLTAVVHLGRTFILDELSQQRRAAE